MAVFSHIRRAGADARDNAWPLALATATIFLIFLLAGAFGLLYLNLRHLVDAWQDNVRLMVYLAPEGERPGGEALGTGIRSLPGVEKVVFIPRERALADLRESMPGQESLFEGFSENPLPDAYEVRIKGGPDANLRVRETAQKIAAMEGVSDVEYGEAALARFQGFLDLFGFVAAAFAALLFAATLSITANTIRLALYNRQEEVAVMRLVGATEGYVRAPFYIEAAGSGLLAGILALGALYGATLLARNGAAAGPWLGRFTLLFFPWWAWALFLAAAAAMGLLGCFLTFTRKSGRL